jgi:hypothetical protein
VCYDASTAKGKGNKEGKGHEKKNMRNCDVAKGWQIGRLELATAVVEGGRVGKTRALLGRTMAGVKAGYVIYRGAEVVPHPDREQGGGGAPAPEGGGPGGPGPGVIVAAVAGSCFWRQMDKLGVCIVLHPVKTTFAAGAGTGGTALLGYFLGWWLQ